MGEHENKIKRLLTDMTMTLARVHGGEHGIKMAVLFKTPLKAGDMHTASNLLCERTKT